MSEPTITCPNCKSEIKLTESLAAPLIDATRRQYDQKIAQKDAEVARREAAIRDHEAALARQKAAIDAETEDKLKAGREGRTGARTTRRRKRDPPPPPPPPRATPGENWPELQEVLRERDTKLAE